MARALRSRPCIVLVLLALSLALANAQTKQEPVEADENRALSQGQQIAAAISTVTSTAISPLFGVCAVGIYQYVRTPANARAVLPFYSKPSFWIPIGVLLILILLKDTVGGAIPLLKKPLDALGVLVLNKAALILVAFPVTIHEISRLTGVQFTEFFSAIEPVAYAADFSTVTSAGHVAIAAFGLIAGLLVTFIMWLAGHMLDVLSLLTPLPFVDLLLKGFRNAVVLALLGLTLVSPRAGLLSSLVLIAIGVLVFSKALRLSIMGSYFAWDLLRSMAGHRTTPVRQDGVLGFSVGKAAGVPAHTLGRITQGESGNLEFRYRMLGFGPHRRRHLDSAGDYQIGRGLLYPSVLRLKRDGSRYRVQFRLPPRYKGREDNVRTALGASDVQDLLLQKSWRRFLNWAETDIGLSRGPRANPVD